MPDYPGRVLDLEKDFAVVRREIAQMNPSEDPFANIAKFASLSAAIVTYGEVREKALTSSLLLLIPDDEATSESQQLKWSTALNRHGSEAFERFNNLVKNEKDPLQLAFEFMAMQESAAYEVFAGMPLAGFTGQIRTHMRRMVEEAESLWDAWEEQTGQTERMDGQIAAMRNQVLDEFRRAVAEIRGWGPRTESALQTAAEAWNAKEGTDPEPSVGSSAAEASKNILATVEQLRRTHEQAVQAALPAFSGKLTIHQMYGNTRQQLKEFLDEVNPEKVATALKEAIDASEKAAALFHKDGMKQDAKVFVAKITAAAREVTVKFNEEWARFYGSFRGIYVEEPTEATVEKLAEAEFFNRFWRDVEGLDLPAAFRTAEDSIRRCESITLSKITPEQKRRLTEVIQVRTTEMKEIIRRMDMSLFTRLKLFYYDIPLDQMRDRVKRLTGYRR